MATLTIAYDHSRDPMNPVQLADQIQTALSIANQPNVDINPTQIVVSGTGITAGTQATIQGLINAYVYDLSYQGIQAGNAGALQRRAQQALSGNDTFLAIASPTNAQVIAQVKMLTRECSALIRLVIGQTDSTAGT